jgi:hypothetical protein
MAGTPVRSEEIKKAGVVVERVRAWGEMGLKTTMEMEGKAL